MPRLTRRRVTLLAALASAVAATPAAGASAPHEVELGFNEDWLGRPEAIGLARDVGATLARFPGGWKEVEATGWGRFDWLYEAASEHGIRLVWKEVNAPCSAHSGPCAATPASPPDLDHLDEFAAHLRAVVRRYPGLAAVEIGNEPNLPLFFGGEPDPEHYVRLLAAGHEAVKSVRPGLPVLFGGVAGTVSAAGGKVPYDVFLRRTHELGAARFYDAMSFHPYPERQDAPGYLAEIGRKVATVKREMARGGAGGRPIWITEIGLWTPAGGAEGVSFDAQAERTVAIYESLRRTPGIEAIIVHRLFDLPPGSGREAGWGVIGADRRTPKPAYCELGQARLGALPRACPAAPPPPPDDGPPWVPVALGALSVAALVALFLRLRFRRSREHPQDHPPDLARRE